MEKIVMDGNDGAVPCPAEQDAQMQDIIVVEESYLKVSYILDGDGEACDRLHQGEGVLVSVALSQRLRFCRVFGPCA